MDRPRHRTDAPDRAGRAEPPKPKETQLQSCKQSVCSAQSLRSIYAVAPWTVLKLFRSQGLEKLASLCCALMTVSPKRKWKCQLRFGHSVFPWVPVFHRLVAMVVLLWEVVEGRAEGSGSLGGRFYF